MTERPLLAFLLKFALLLLGVCVAAPARAETARPPSRGSITLTTANNSQGPVDLVSKEGGFVGEFAIRNTGAEPLTVSRIAIRGDDDDVRAPSRLTARLSEGGGSSTTIQPNASKSVQVLWLPEKEPRMKQVFAHVIVTSSDEAKGEVAVGVRADIPRGFVIVTAHALSWLVFLPLLGCLIVLGLHFAGYKDDKNLRYLALAITGAQCLLALWLYDSFNPDVTRADGNDGFQFIEHVVWLRSLNVEYFVGVDGASMPMVLLTALMSFVGVLASFGLERRLKGYFGLYFLLITGLMGVFVSLDLFLFFLFLELMLVPTYFLIGIWGGPNRGYAATKFFIYTLVGSGLMLLSFIALYLNADRTFLVDGTSVSRTFSIPELMRVSYNAKHLTIMGFSFVKVIWVALFVAFAIKIPMFPFHTWLPDAHVESPTGVTVILTGVMLKVGVYGILRISFGLLPEASRWAAGTVVAFGVISVVYGALCAMAQQDLKRMLAYGTVSQMGFCLIGLGSLTPEGIAAALVQMFSHGVIMSMLIILAGILYERAHTREIGHFGGLAGEMPLYSAFFGFALMASMGLPGLAGFWGEILALFGAMPSYRMLTAIAALGLVLNAAYHLWALQRIFFGKLKETWRTSPYLEPFGGKFPEITTREMASLAPLVVLCLVLGLWPVPLFTLIAGSVRDLTTLVNPPGPDQIALLWP